MARKYTLPSIIKIILKTHYPLPCAESESSEHDQVESDILKHWQMARQRRSPSPLPCAEPESLGDDQIESDSLGALTDGQEEERWEISLVVRPDDMTGKHRKRREIPLVRVQVLGGEAKVEPKRELTLKQSPLAGTGLDGPGQLHLEMQQTAVDGFLLANGTRSSGAGGSFPSSKPFWDKTRENTFTSHRSPGFARSRWSPSTSRRSVVPPLAVAGSSANSTTPGERSPSRSCAVKVEPNSSSRFRDITRENRFTSHRSPRVARSRWSPSTSRRSIVPLLPVAGSSANSPTPGESPARRCAVEVEPKHEPTLCCTTSCSCRLIGKLANSGRALTCEVVFSSIVPKAARRGKAPLRSELLVSSANEKPPTAIRCVSRCSCPGPSSPAPPDGDCLSVGSRLGSTSPSPPTCTPTSGILLLKLRLKRKTSPSLRRTTQAIRSQRVMGRRTARWRL